MQTTFEKMCGTYAVKPHTQLLAVRLLLYRTSHKDEMIHRSAYKTSGYKNQKKSNKIHNRHNYVL